MKKYIQIVLIHIKMNKWYIMIYLMYTYVFLSMLLLDKSMKLWLNESVIYTYMQQLLIFPSVMLLSLLYNVYVEKNYAELINSIDNHIKLKYIIGFYLIIVILQTPLLLILTKNYVGIKDYISIYLLQLFCMISLYYFIVQFTQSSLAALVLVICYIVIFAIAYTTQELGNIFLINKFIFDISKDFYRKLVLYITICIGFASMKEKIKLS